MIGQVLRARRRHSGSQAGFSLVETLVAVTISALIAGPIGAWMILVFTAQAPTAAGFTDAGQSRLLNTFVTRDVSSSEILIAATPPPTEPPVGCSGAPDGATVLLNIYDLGAASSMIVYGTVDESGSTTMYRWECDITVDHVVLEESVVLRDVATASATCEDDPDLCSKVTVEVALDSGHETSVTASRRASAASLAGFGGTTTPVPFIAEDGRTTRTPGNPMTVDLVASAVDSDTAPGDLEFTWSVSGPAAASLSSNTGTAVTFSASVAGDYTVELEVFDGLNTATLPYSISVVNIAPTISTSTCVQDDALPDRYVCDAAASDVDSNDALTYEWRYPVDALGGEASLSGSSVVIDLDAALQGVVVVELRVSDDESGVATRANELQRGTDPLDGITTNPELVNLPGHLPRLLSTDGDAASRTGTFATVDTDTTRWELLDGSGTLIEGVDTNSAQFTHVFDPGESGDRIVRRIRGAQPYEEVLFRVNAAPAAGFSAAASPGNAPKTITFTETGDDDYGEASFEWDFSAIGPFAGLWTASGSPVAHTFTHPGTYAVQLRVTDIDGVTSTVSEAFAISGVPAQPDPPAWDPARPDYVTFPPVPGATGYIITFTYTGSGSPACLRTVDRQVFSEGPYEARDAGNSCAAPTGTSASLKVVANAATSPASTSVDRP